MSTATYRNIAFSCPLAVYALTLLLGLTSSSILDADSARTLNSSRWLTTDQGAVATHASRPRSATEQLKQAIEHHDESRLDKAIAAWDTVALPEDREVWRYIALAVAHLYDYRFELAEEEFSNARSFDSDNAVVHYFYGLLCLSRAELMDDEPDAVQSDPPRLAGSSASTPKGLHRTRLGNIKNRYKREAMSELKLAIEAANSTEYDSVPLTNSNHAPTVTELLIVLGADNFVGKAHGLLAHLNLERGHPSQAEHHIDEASSYGIPVPYGYRLAGDRYEELGRNDDASKAYAKAERAGDVLASPDAIEARLTELFKQLLQAPSR